MLKQMLGRCSELAGSGFPEHDENALMKDSRIWSRRDMQDGNSLQGY
jgi:hypothetical protein